MKQSAEMRKTYFIINPAAGNYNLRNLVSEIEEAWGVLNIPYEIGVSESPEDLQAKVRSACQETFTEIVIAGGDGTLLEAVEAAQGAAVQFGILPCGTGNDLARSLSIPRNTAAALKRIAEAKEKVSVDIGLTRSKLFLNVASVGIDAAIVHRVQRLKRWIKGPLAYLLASVLEVLTYEPMEATVELDGQVTRGRYWLLAAANGKYYGGGMMIAPDARYDDGLYSFIQIEALPRWRLLYLLPSVYSGGHIRQPEVHVHAVRSVKVQPKLCRWVNVDGNLLEESVLEVRPPEKQIKIIK